MRRLARHLFTLASAVSLLLCVAVCVLWVRSYWVAERANFFGESTYLALLSARGSLVVQFVQQPVIAKGTHWFLLNRWGADETRGFRMAGVNGRRNGAFRLYDYEPATVATDRSNVTVSYWAVASVLALPAIVRLSPALSRAVKRFQRWRLPAPGLCRNCGYDLRASPERCPECGAPARGSA